MKASDKPEFSVKWWASEKPSDVKGADLEKALKAAEKALADEKKKCDADSIAACLAALGALNSTVDCTIKKELDKKKHKDPISVLEKFDALINAETKRLEKAQAEITQGDEEDEGEDDESDPSDDKLFDREYLVKCVKRLRKKPMLFGFGLSSQPESCVLVLKRKGQPKQLGMLVRREKGLRKVTYGVARADESDIKTLVFELEGKQLPGLAKKGRLFLRAADLLPFRDVRLIVDGKEVEDLPEVEGDVGGEGSEGDEEELVGAAAGATGGRTPLNPERKAEVRRQFSRIESELRKMAAEIGVSV